jgi:hypothetical protein
MLVGTFGIATPFWAGETSVPTPGQAVRITSVVRPDPRTGRLVRSMVVDTKPVAQPAAAATVPAAASPDVEEIVEQIARAESLPPRLIHSVIKVESNYNPRAVSPKGALGMMQLVPDTARRFGVADAFNPADNIQGGARYLRYLLDLYGGNYPLALAAYNAGEAAVAKYGTVPPYAETQNYLKLVARHLAEPPKPQAATAKEQKAQPAEAGPGGPAHVAEVTETDGTVRYVSR